MVSELQIDEILTSYPGLDFDHKTGLLVGFIDIDEDDRYYVEIDTRPFPSRFPRVLEVAERIPRTNDRHCNLPDGTLCFTTKPKEQILLATAIRRLSDFISEILLPYLQNNSWYEIHREYRFGTYPHGRAPSLFQTYLEVFEVNDGAILETLLSRMVSGSKLSSNEECYCCNGRKFKKCGGHFECYRRAKHISHDTLAEGLRAVQDYLADERMRVSAATA